MTTSSSEIINVGQLIRLHSFQFSLFMSKDIIEEFIPIIMSKLSVIVFGYKKNEDKYWGKMLVRKDKQATAFTMSFTRIKEKETTCVISVFNASDINSQTIAENIFKKVAGVETTKNHFIERA
jgi:hypothetical protein